MKQYLLLLTGKKELDYSPEQLQKTQWRESFRLVSVDNSKL